LRTGHQQRFVKQYADMRALLHRAACNYAADVETGPEHNFRGKEMALSVAQLATFATQ
jgi:ketopantoate hydroxymethyltransferase